MILGPKCQSLRSHDHYISLTWVAFSIITRMHGSALYAVLEAIRAVYGIWQI